MLESIKNAPKLQMGLELYWSAFWDLTTARPSGFGVSYISWLDVDEYARRVGMDEDQTDELHFVIREMDDAFVAHHSPNTPKGGDSWQSQGVSKGSRPAWGSSQK